ncbi:hypothetical protein K439DRAFT_1662109 [Ramaria rubella]|nr:hypothetical protein K439DRAFT_1662109 [Ramaria rubella]
MEVLEAIEQLKADVAMARTAIHNWTITPQLGRTPSYIEIRKSLLEISRCLSEAVNDTSPINRLPDDVLNIIFADIAYRPPIALHLSRVCRRWRNTVHAQPSLWIRIDRYYPPLVELCLQLSKSASIELLLHSYGESDCQNFDSDTLTCLPSLSPHLHRVSAVDIDAEPSIAELFWHHIAHGIGPRLKTLSMTSHESSAHNLPQLIQDTPLLRDITFFRCSPPASSSVWDDLEILHLEDVGLSFSEHLQLLSQSPALKWLYISNISQVPEAIPTSVSKFALNHLKSLTLFNCSLAHVLEFFAGVNMPNLSKLAIDNIAPGIEAIMVTFFQNLRRLGHSMSLLRQIKLLGFSFFNHGVLIGWFKATANGPFPDFMYRPWNNPNPYEDVMDIFPHVEIVQFTISQLWRSDLPFSLNIGVSHTVRTLRIIIRKYLSHDTVDWMSLAQVLAERRNFVNLDRVELEFVPSICDGFASIKDLFAHSLTPSLSISDYPAVASELGIVRTLCDEAGINFSFNPIDEFIEDADGSDSEERGCDGCSRRIDRNRDHYRDHFVH